MPPRPPPDSARQLAPAVAAACALARPAAALAGARGEPLAPGPALSAALWIRETLPGNLVAAVLVLGAAAAGFAVLTGRPERTGRWGAPVLAACVVLFGGLLVLAGLEAAPG